MAGKAEGEWRAKAVTRNGENALKKCHWYGTIGGKRLTAVWHGAFRQSRSGRIFHHPGRRCARAVRTLPAGWNMEIVSTASKGPSVRKGKVR